MDKQQERPEQAGSKRRWTIESVVTLAVFMTVGCLGAVTAAYFMRGSFRHVLIIIPLFIIGIVCLGTALVFYGIAVKKRRIGWLRAANITAGLLLLMVLQVPGYMLGMGLLQSDIRDAKIFCEQLVVHLDRYYQEHGSYPVDIHDLLPTDAPIPPILRDNYYHSNRDNFSFDFTNPGGMFNGYVYDSTTRRWDEWD